MNEFINKLIERLECETIEMISNVPDGEFLKGNVNFSVIARGIINQLAEEYKDKEYCWQSCASTEHCKECRRLGNGYIDYFEDIANWGE